VATLWLVGMMGAGKSTVGPLVARRLGRGFVDLDEAVAAAAGRSIQAVFATEGEAGFRRREAAVLADAAGLEVVVACGGGIVVDPANVALMRRTGRVAWLAAPAEVLEARVGDGAGRPLAGEAGAEVAARLASREAAYAAAAHWRVEVAGRTPADVAEEVVRRWSESG
jgi:shikimate kinase